MWGEVGSGWADIQYIQYTVIVCGFGLGGFAGNHRDAIKVSLMLN